MTTGEFESLQPRIDALSEVDLDSKIEDAFQGKVLSDVKIGEESVTTFLELWNQVLTSLGGVRTPKDYIPLPKAFASYDGSSRNLMNEIEQLTQSAKSGNFSNAMVHLKHVIHYLVLYGLWFERNKFEEDARRTKRLLANLEAKRAEFSIALAQASDLSKNAKILQSSASEFLESKRAEFQALSQNLESSNRLLEQIRGVQTDVNSVNASVTESESSLKKTLERIEATEGSLSSRSDEAFNKLRTIETLTTSSADSILRIEGIASNFEQRQSLLDDVLGQEVGRSLFNTFNERREILAVKVGNWLRIVMAAAAATVLGVIALLFFDPLNHSTGRALSVTLGLPLYWLLYYAIAQYNKERKYEEQYAFKSAVALTVNAYAGLIDGDKKTLLISDSVKGIYAEPWGPEHEESSATMAGDLIKVLRQALRTIDRRVR